MFATPLTLSAAALSWIPFLNIKRCSTIRIRQGDRFVLFHWVLCYACIMRTSLSLGGCGVFFSPWAKLRVLVSANACIFLCIRTVPVWCVCVSKYNSIMFNCAACVFSLSYPKGMSCQEKGWNSRDQGPVVNLEHWFCINSWLATDSWPYKCRCKGNRFHPLPNKSAQRKPIREAFIMHTHCMEGSL